MISLADKRVKHHITIKMLGWDLRVCKLSRTHTTLSRHLFPMDTFLFQSLEKAIAELQFLSLEDLFVCFVALRPKSTAMVMVGQSVH